MHQELLKIYLFKDLKEEQFPPFPKAKFFGNNIKVFRKGRLQDIVQIDFISYLFTTGCQST